MMEAKASKMNEMAVAVNRPVGVVRRVEDLINRSVSESRSEHINGCSRISRLGSIEVRTDSGLTRTARAACR